MRPGRLLTAALALLLLAAAPAWAVSRADGDLFVTFGGGIKPKFLPRDTPAPVSVLVSGDIRSLSGDTDNLAQLRSISVGINRQGELFDHGLPVCDVAKIQPATQKDARKACSSSLIGSGHVTVQVRVPAQKPFMVRARLLAFNGPYRNGHKLIFAQAYARRPPNSFVLTFHVSHQDGEFGTVLSTTLPRRTRRWAYLTHFDMKLHRTYTYRGSRRSFVSAACAAPDGFAGATFPFAEATYGFADGREISVSETGVCRVARQ